MGKSHRPQQANQPDQFRLDSPQRSNRPGSNQDQAQKVADASEAVDAGLSVAAGGGKETPGDGKTGQKRGEPPITVSAGSFEKQGLRAGVLEKALTAFRAAWAKGDTEKLIFTVIDFSLPSDQKRLFVIDLESGKLLFCELVAHGSGSGGRMATRFSNREGSNSSSLGLSRTAETYESAKFADTALRIDGLEKGFNDQMRNRAVVMHQAAYATPAAIETNRRAGESRLGRSQGCPALDPEVAGDVIKTIKNGTLIFSYYPDPAWLERSKYLNP
jgi:hypothetical protein